MLFLFLALSFHLHLSIYLCFTFVSYFLPTLFISLTTLTNFSLIHFSYLVLTSEFTLLIMLLSQDINPPNMELCGPRGQEHRGQGPRARGHFLMCPPKDNSIFPGSSLPPAPTGVLILYKLRLGFFLVFYSDVHYFNQLCDISCYYFFFFLQMGKVKLQNVK